MRGAISKNGVMPRWPENEGSSSAAQLAEPVYTDPYVRWCDRDRLPMSIEDVGFSYCSPRKRKSVENPVLPDRRAPLKGGQLFQRAFVLDYQGCTIHFDKMLALEVAEAAADGFARAAD